MRCQGVVICLEWGAGCLHVVQLMALHPKTPSSLASFTSRLVLPFWYRLTQVVLEKRLLNGSSVVVIVVVQPNKMFRPHCKHLHSIDAAYCCRCCTFHGLCVWPVRWVCKWLNWSRFRLKVDSWNRVVDGCVRWRHMTNRITTLNDLCTAVMRSFCEITVATCSCTCLLLCVSGAGEKKGFCRVHAQCLSAREMAGKSSIMFCICVTKAACVLVALMYDMILLLVDHRHVWIRCLNLRVDLTETEHKFSMLARSVEV